MEGNPKRFFRVRQGHNLKLRCPVVGDQPFKIEWFKVCVDMVEFSQIQICRKIRRLGCVTRALMRA